MQIKFYIIGCVATAAMMLVGCTDDWNSHYSDKRDGGAGKSLIEQLKADPELSQFVSMVERSGYSELLGSSQSLTVWAPVNGSLTDVNMDDDAEMQRTVSNHIARFNISTATPEDVGVKMLNGKLLYFSENASLFGDAPMVEADIRAKNGVLHKVASPISYSYNFREYFDTHPETSSLSEFIAQFDQKLLPSELPGAANTSSTDTVAVSYNRLLQYPVYGLGNIASEDSVFTMVIPDNVAWQKTYDEIWPYFKTFDADPARADSIQDAQTKLAIVNDLIFRTGLQNPLALDSVVSTSGSVISNPAAFFSGMQEMSASNGRIFLTSALNYEMAETFNKPIKVEAEEQWGRTPAAGTTVYTRNITTDNDFADRVSGQQYLEVSPSSTSRQPGITFSLPNTLAGAYDIYAVFVPAVAADPTNVNDSTKLQFAVTFLGENGRSQSKSFSDNNFVTSPTDITTIKVASAFKFPTANYYDRIWLADPQNDINDRIVSSSIYISTNVSNSEFNNNQFTRRFRIDRVYLIPVKEDDN